MKNYKIRFVFPNRINLYVLGLRATKVSIRSMLYFLLFNFLCNHFVLVGKPKINLNLYKYNAITRIDSISNIIKFYANYIGNYIILRKDFDQKNRVVLHAKADVNLHLVKRNSRAVNFMNISETETYWVNLTMIGLLIVKVFLKHNINIFIHIFFIQLFLLLLTLYLFKKRSSHHSKIRLCITKTVVLLESIKFCYD